MKNFCKRCGREIKFEVGFWIGVEDESDIICKLEINQKDRSIRKWNFEPILHEPLEKPEAFNDLYNKLL